MFIKVQLIHKNAQLPKFAGKNETGADLYSVSGGTIYGGEHKIVSTGIKIAPGHISDTCDIQIRPRSGLAAKHAVTVLNSPGTIDKTYRGEIKVILINHGDEKYVYETGDRIAQMVVAPHYTNVEYVEVETLDETERNEGGLGSTGK